MLSANMSSNRQNRRKDEFQIDQCVWARRSTDGLYWPGKVTSISLQRSATTNPHHHQLRSYLVFYFHSNHSNWTVDVLPYREYRDYFSKHLMLLFQSNFEVGNQLIRALHQTDQYSQIPTSHPSCFSGSEMSHSNQESYTWNYTYENPSTSWYSSCPCCPSTYHSGPNETFATSNTNSKDFKSITGVVVIANRNYSSPSFLSYLHHSLSSFTYRSIHYIDPITTNNNTPPQPFPPTVSNIIYLICFDQCSTTIEQIIDTTILHNLHPHLTYYFVLLNIPSQSLVNHLYDNVMDKRSILIVQYYSSFDESSLLVCSGDRQTFDTLAEPFLKCLSVKIKYLDESISSSTSDESSSFDSNRTSIRTKKNKMKSTSSNALANTSTECNVKNILEQSESNK